MPTSDRPSPRADPAELRQLIAATAGGDRHAFTTLAQHVTPLIYGRARAILRSDAHAQDVVQLVLVKLWQNADRFDVERGSVLALVTTLTRNTSVDLVRDEERVERRRQAAVRHLNRDRTDVDDQVELGFIQEEVRVALDTLPDSQRVAVELAYYGGLTYVEVADRLGEAEGTVKSRIRRAMLTMSDILAGES